MNHPTLNNAWRIVSRKLAVILLLAVSAFTAFASLGDGRAKSTKIHGSLLTDKDVSVSGNFSLRSGYSFRGNQVINTQVEKYFNLNTVVTIQKGHTTYILPLKRKVILDKITFNPNSESRRY